MKTNWLQLPGGTGKRIGLLVLAAGFVLAGFNHFHNPGFYLKIMPPYLPAHLMLIYISGFFEILGGLGVLLFRVRAVAGLGLVLLMLAVFPANVHMAMHPELFPKLPAVGLLARLPLQFLMIAWAWWVTRADDANP